MPAEKVSAAGNTPPIQVFFVPMPEDSTLVALKKINSSAAAPMHSVIGVSITANNTVMYYDQWENGYDTDLANPANLWSAANLGGTQIWGNGKAADGCAPNRDGKTALTCSDANDVLGAGNVIVLENDVPLPRTASIYFDGKDKLGATKVIAVTRSVWAATPGTVMTDAIEVYDTTRWSTAYTVPIGETTDATSLMFKYTSMFVSAAQNGTTVAIDKNGDGSVDITQVMNQGDTYLIDGGVNANAAVNSDKPVQVDLLTGKPGSTYSNRWFQVPPNSYWTTSLWTAVGTTTASYPANVFLFNPGAAAINVQYETKSGSGTLAVPAHGNARFVMPLLSGAHFYTAGAPFVAVGAMDSSTAGANSTYDWGYTLVPDVWLTTAFVAGWAPGTSTLTGNGSPVWVTATRATTIYVDYGDPAPAAASTAPNGKKYDVSYAVGQFESKQIYGVGNTQTGMKVFTADGTSITGAWGEDPAKASAGTPYLDAGYTIPPLPEVVLTKQASLAPGGDVNSNGKMDPGDTLLYTVTMRNNGAVTAFNTSVKDSVPDNTSYVANSTALDGDPVADNPGFPLLEAAGGLNVPILPVGSSAVITYRLTANQFPPVYSNITNTVKALVNGDELTITIETPINNNSSQCTLNFTDAGGATVSSYLMSDSVFVRITDSDTQGKGPLAVQVLNSTADRQALSLVETGADTGIYQNASGLSLSSAAGLLPDDGILNARAGDTLTVSYTDSVYGDTCSASAPVTVPAQIKQLYLNDTLTLDRVDPAASADGTTALSSELSAGGGSSTVAIGGTTTGASSSGAVTSLTFAHTPGSGSGRLLLVAVGTGSPDNSDAQGAVSGVTFNGIAMTQAGFQNSSGSGTNTNAYIYYLKDASINTSGAANIVVSSTSSTLVASATTFTGVNQTTPLGTAVTATGTANPISATVTSAAGELIYSIGSIEQGNTNRAISTSAGQTELWNISNHAYVNAATSTKAGGASVSLGYGNANSRNGVLVAVAIKPINDPGNPTVTFSQSPAMAGSFQLPAASTVSLSAYVDVTGGSLPAAPAITATLKHGTSLGTATTFATLGSAAYDSAGGLLTLSGVLGGSVTTIPTGDSVYLTLTTAQAGASFQLRYDSQTYPSKITLPTSTVIQASSLQIYDAAYPGGALLVNPNNGQTVYIRAILSDPFGAYDITSADLAISGPGGYTHSQTLAAAAVVASGGAQKTYETAWTAPAGEGTYTFSLTGHEGLEAAISDSRSIQTDIFNKDTGTPGSVEFTSGDNGPAVTSYDATAAPGSQICLRVTDFDQNRNPAAAETLGVNVTSSAPDSQSITLTETGVNTGIFSACVSRDETSAGDSETLYAISGSFLSATYTDPNDSGDVSSANAVLTTPGAPASLSLSKQLIEPPNGFAPLGDSVRFDIAVANPSSVTLNEVTVTDTFPQSCLSYASASIPPSSTSAPNLVWDDLGSLAPNSSLTLSVYFTVTAACDPAQNSVSAGAVNSVDSLPVTASPAAAEVVTTRPAISVSKTLLSTSPALIGSDVTYRLEVENTGGTRVTELPLSDQFSSFCLAYKSATVTPDVSMDGYLHWNDLGALNSGATSSVDVTFSVAGACSQVSNVASVNGALDEHGDELPPAQNAHTALVTEGSADLAVTITDGVASYHSGDTLTYTITVVNNGPDGVGGAVVDNALPAGLTNASWSCVPDANSYCTPAGAGSIHDTGVILPAGGSVTYTVTTTVAANPPETITNTATVAVPSGMSDPDPDNNTATDSDTLTPPQVDLLIGITDGLESVDAGGSTTYTITVENKGPDGSNGAVLSNILATGLSKVSLGTCTATGGAVCPAAGSAAGQLSIANLQAGSVVIPTLPSGGRISFTVVTDVTATGGSVTSPAGVTPPSGTENLGTSCVSAAGITRSFSAGVCTSSDTDSINPLADLSISKTASKTSLNMGDAIEYEIVVANGGPSPADGALLTDPLVTGITVTAVSCGSETGSAVCPTLSATQSVNVAALQGTGIAIPTLPAGGSVTFTLTATVDADPGTVTNAAAVAPPEGVSDPETDDNDADDGGVSVYQPRVISGNVWRDDNGDGVHNPLSETTGLYEVKVELYSDPNGDGDPSDGTVQATVYTDEDGFYSFTGYAPNHYVIVETDPTDTLSSGDVAGVNDNRIPLQLVVDTTYTGNDFMDVPAGVIAGHVWEDQDDDGQFDTGEPPLSGVVIRLYSDPNGDGDPSDGELFGSTTTDSNGHYSFGGLEPGDYVLVQVNRLGYEDSGDTQGANDSRVALTLGEGASSIQNDFLDANSGQYWLFLPLIARPENIVSETFQIGLGYEDLSLITGQNDYDYNDWNIGINIVLTKGEVSGLVRQMDLTFIPRARGASLNHTFEIVLPPNTFSSSGSATLTLYDGSYKALAVTKTAFQSGQANAYVVFPKTADALPGSKVNVKEGEATVAPSRYASLTIVFDAPVVFSLTGEALEKPHGENLFFDPYLKVIQSGEQIHSGDLRLLVVPSSSNLSQVSARPPARTESLLVGQYANNFWLWPEEGVRIDRAYPLVTFQAGNPPLITFAAQWWTQATTCVYDGVACGAR